MGLFVGFNLPVHHKKYQAGVLEAEERALADAKLYEAQRDEAFSEIQDFMVQAKVQENVLSLLRDSIEPRTRATLELREATTPRPTSTMRRCSPRSREVLQVQLQIAQVTAELGKALAGLERRGRSADQPRAGVNCARAPPDAASPFRAQESQGVSEPQ